MNERIPMTPEGHARLKEELDRLKHVERMQNIKDIEEARAHGDLSENAEYHAAKDRQGHIDARTRVVEDRLARAQVIDPAEQDCEDIRFGASVDLADEETGDKVAYKLVGEDESDAKKGFISITSPVAQALIGKEEGDIVKVRIPKGTREFEILKITYR